MAKRLLLNRLSGFAKIEILSKKSSYNEKFDVRIMYEIKIGVVWKC